MAFRRSEPLVHPGPRALGHAEELLQPVVAELPHKIPQPEHVLEELIHRSPPRRFVASNRAELRLPRLGHQPGTEDLRSLGAGGPPRSHPYRLVPGREVSGRLLYRLAVVGPEES